MSQKLDICSTCLEHTKPAVCLGAMATLNLTKVVLLGRRKPEGNAYEVAVERMGSAIRMGLFRVGERLPSERDLSSHIGVSRATLREAIRLLSEQGTLEARRGRNGGTFVMATPDPLTVSEMREKLTERNTTLREVLDQRKVIEVGVVELAAQRATAIQIAQLKDMLPRFAEFRMVTMEYRRLDTEFHLLIGEAADSPRLQELLAECHRDLSEMMSAVPHSSEIRGHSTLQHAEIVRAIAARDPAAARTAMVEHVAGTSSFLIGLIGEAVVAPHSEPSARAID